MKITPSVKQIIAIAFPIMIGSAAQNILTLSDSIFLFHLSEIDFAAIGFVGVFYLTINAIGYGFSKGGQILIAQKAGNSDQLGIRQQFQALGIFEIALAFVLFLFMYYCSPWFFKLFLQNEEVYKASLEFIKYRSFGVFFSYLGVTLIAFYTGIAKTKIILYETLFLLVINGILNYVLIFGKWGFPSMGIGGSALASTIAEALGSLAFFIYLYFDKTAREIKVFSLPSFNFKHIIAQFSLAAPIVVQNFIGLGSWFMFFAIIEDMGERPLAISNLMRIIYLILSIPCWGFSSATNTIIGNLMGQKKFNAILPTLYKTSAVCFIFTAFISLPIILWPELCLYPLLGKQDMTIVTEAKPSLKILFLIIGSFSLISIFVNGISGIGATIYGLAIQVLSAAFYLISIYYTVDVLHASLSIAWSCELIFWLVQGLGCFFFFLRFNPAKYSST